MRAVIGKKRYKVNPALYRFALNIERLPNGCWEWQGTKDHVGYGIFNTDRKTYMAHRFAYEFFIGPIPDQLECDHLCRNCSCVNPLHIELVTHKENSRRGHPGRPCKAR